MQQWGHVRVGTIAFAWGGLSFQLLGQQVHGLIDRGASFNFISQSLV